MSIDLTVKKDISKDAQYIQDQNNHASALSISSGNVGVATTKPTALLSVQANPYPADAINVQNTKGQPIVSLKQGTNGHGNFFIQRTDGSTAAKLTGGSGYVCAKGGNFGVGTNDPGAQLDVDGDVRCESLTVTNGTTISFTKVPPASKAPDPSRLESLFIDPKTGKLYYQ